VRHGQSTWNDSRLVQGQRDDAQLTPLGRSQALEAAQSLRGTSYDAIISSDLSRALETARIIGQELAVPVRTDAQLRERSFGEFEGAPLDELTPALSGIQGGWVVDVSAHPIGGESLDELFARTALYLEHLISQQQGRRIILVTHGGTIRAIRAYLEGRSMTGLEWDAVANCSIWPLEMAVEPTH